MYWGLKLWNNLSEDFKLIDSVNIFKSRILRQLRISFNSEREFFSFPFQVFITLRIIKTSLFDLPCHRNSMKLMQIIKILVNLSHTNYVEHYFPKHKLSAAELISMFLI